MTQADLERHIHIENRNTHSVNEQARIALALVREEITPNHDGLRKDQIEELLDEDLEYTVDTSLDHLVECDVVEVVEPSRDAPYVISERLDEIILGRVDEVAEEEIESLIDHIHDADPVDDDGNIAVADGAGITVRDTVAQEFDLHPESLEEFLREGDQVDKLNQSIDAIEESEHVEKRESYDRITFRFPANRYRLTEFAIQLLNE